MTNKTLGLSDDDAVFINEHLTPENKKLLGAAVARKKQMKWKFVWTNGSKIFARQNEGTDVLMILDRDDLNKMT